jgi:hypothetical protein
VTVEEAARKAARSIWGDGVEDYRVRFILPVLKGPQADGGRRPVTEAERAAKRQFDIDVAT